MKYTLIKPSLSGLRRKACHMEVTLHQKGIKVILGYIFLNITIVNILFLYVSCSTLKPTPHVVIAIKEQKRKVK